MKMSFPSDSQYLAQTDFDESGTNCTIKDVRSATMDDDKSKWILHLNQFDKGMVLNQTNGTFLILQFGDEANDWSGKWINIYVDPSVGYGGKVTGGLRIRKPQRPQETDWNPDMDREPSIAAGPDRVYPEPAPSNDYEPGSDT
jgi:hypothetical protein